MKAKLLCTTILVLGMTPIFAHAAIEAGGTESPFALGTGARALGLGKAFTAVADDVTALYWNPAGLAQLRQMELGACHIFLNEGTTYDMFGYVHPFYGVGTLGLAGMHIQTSGIERRDDHDYLLGTFDYRQSQGLLSLGRELFPGLGAGVSLKVEQMALDSYLGTGTGLDVGFLYNPANTYSVGLILQNILSPEIRLKGPASLPLNVRLGGAYRYRLDREGNHQLLAAVDLETPSSNLVFIHGGLEYSLYHILALRAGWDRDRLTGGAGFAFQGIELNYALTYQEAGGYLHIASANWRFGLPVDEAERARRQKIVEEVYARLVQEQFERHRAEGTTALNSDEYANAVNEYKKALGWKSAPEIEINLAKAQELMNRQTARQYYAQGKAKSESGQQLDALVTLREALRLNPADEAVRLQIRDLKAKLLRRAQAVRLKGEKKRLRTLFTAALNRYLEGEYGKAYEGWREILDKNPTYPDAKDYAGQAQRVVLRQEMMASVKDQDAEVQVKAKLTQAEALYARRQFAQAREAWQSALKADPTCEAAKLGMERADLLLKALQVRGVE